MLFIATGAAAVVGAGSLVWPLISQMNPDASTIAAGVPVDVDLSGIEVGQIVTVQWRGNPIFVRRRTKKEIDDSVNVDVATLRDPQTDAQRVKKAEWLVVIGVCTHLGCIPTGHEGPYEGWLCHCHGSVYDTSGRIRSGPAPLNLAVPGYKFDTDTKLTIG